MNIGFLIIGTNKYLDFAESLSQQINTRVKIEGANIHRFIFTNRPGIAQDKFEHRLHISHTPWPLPTLLRYHMFAQYREYLADMDYLFYIDADMRIEKDIGKEILGDLVGTLHPGFYDKAPYYYTYDDNHTSAAFVERIEGCKYFAGGFNGGTRENFLNMTDNIIERINYDLNKHYIALWHDESYLNKYFNNIKIPTNILSPSYCYPEEVNIPFDRIIVALKKDHKSFRND